MEIIDLKKFDENLKKISEEIKSEVDKINLDKIPLCEFKLSEYEKLESGMSLEEVKKIVGGDCIKTSEVEISNSKQVIYTCNAKGEDEATVTLTFFEDKLFAKKQTGLK